MVSCFPSPKTDAKHFDQQEATSVIKLTVDTEDADVDENSETRSSVTLRNWLFERLWGVPPKNSIRAVGQEPERRELIKASCGSGTKKRDDLWQLGDR